MNAPSDSKIDELLEKLQELDPETYQRFREYDIRRDLFDKWTRDRILQGVIQDAVAANDNFIGFDITYTSYFDVKYEAEIFWDQTGETLRGFGETSPDALLAAYVAALDAEATR